jgi:hypothetical protein
MFGADAKTARHDNPGGLQGLLSALAFDGRFERLPDLLAVLNSSKTFLANQNGGRPTRVNGNNR